jgi:hypothetical protein
VHRALGVYTVEPMELSARRPTPYLILPGELACSGVEYVVHIFDVDSECWQIYCGPILWVSVVEMLELRSGGKFRYEGTALVKHGLIRAEVWDP